MSDNWEVAGVEGMEVKVTRGEAIRTGRGALSVCLTYDQGNLEWVQC